MGNVGGKTWGVAIVSMRVVVVMDVVVGMGHVCVGDGAGVGTLMRGAVRGGMRIAVGDEAAQLERTATG